VLVSSPIADHGTAVLLAREDLGIDADVRSDSASVWPVAEALISACGRDLRCLRDPTRGGLATTLNELAADGGLGIELDEEAVPVRDATRGACELLGLDPLVVANEGCLVAVVAPHAAAVALDVVRARSGGEWGRPGGRGGGRTRRSGGGPHRVRRPAGWSTCSPATPCRASADTAVPVVRSRPPFACGGAGRSAPFHRLMRRGWWIHDLGDGSGRAGSGRRSRAPGCAGGRPSGDRTLSEGRRDHARRDPRHRRPARRLDR
jgi:hypothetical protein